MLPPPMIETCDMWTLLRNDDVRSVPITEMFNFASQISPGEHDPVGDQNCATALPRGIAISGPTSSPPGSSHSMISRCGLPTRVPPHEEPDELHPTAASAPRIDQQAI